LQVFSSGLLFSKQEKELPLVALFLQEKMQHDFKKLFTFIWAKK
jgi:hypothetical protein